MSPYVTITVTELPDLTWFDGNSRANRRHTRWVHENRYRWSRLQAGRLLWSITVVLLITKKQRY